MTTLGTRVAALRKRRKLTLEALARLTGLTKGTIWNLEQGVGKPAMQTVERVADALGVGVDTLRASSARKQAR